MTDAVADKAVSFVDQKRVHRRGHVAKVYGFTGTYEVIAITTGVVCSCPAGNNDQLDSCSHKVAAMVAWAEAAIQVAA